MGRVWWCWFGDLVISSNVIGWLVLVVFGFFFIFFLVYLLVLWV